MGNKRQLCTFTLGRLFCGIDVSRVREVLRYREMTPVPLVANEVSGLLNLRGQIVTAIDLRRRLGLPELPPPAQPMNIVVSASDGNVSLLVDNIDDVLELDDDDFERPPESLDSHMRGLLEGVFKLQGSLLHVLQVDSILKIETGVGE
jgi:purine-binding chemotaxis protein CheW